MENHKHFEIENHISKKIKGINKFSWSYLGNQSIVIYFCEKLKKYTYIIKLYSYYKTDHSIFSFYTWDPSNPCWPFHICTDTYQWLCSDGQNAEPNRWRLHNGTPLSAAGERVMAAQSHRVPASRAEVRRLAFQLHKHPSSHYSTYVWFLAWRRGLPSFLGDGVWDCDGGFFFIEYYLKEMELSVLLCFLFVLRVSSH